MCGLCDAYLEPERNWWAFGDYTGNDCPNCSRQRLMRCTDNDGCERVICEKCAWEPAIAAYCADAVGR